MLQFSFPQPARRPLKFRDELVEPEYRIIHRIADRLVAPFMAAILNAVQRIKSSVVLKRVIELLNRGDVEGVLNAVPVKDLPNSLTPTLTDILSDAMKGTAQKLLDRGPSEIALNLSFDITNPRAIAFLRARAAELVTSITEDTRQVLRDIMTRSFIDGIPPKETARLIRDHIGLLPRQSQAVLNFRRKQIADGVKPDQIDKKVARLEAKYLRDRAKMIARTETIRASNAGQQELWQQRVDAGLLSPTAQRVWIVTPDDRLCSICEPLEGEAVGLNETFSGGFDMPPAHPSCRCALGLVT